MREWAGAEPRAGVRRLRRGSRACSPMGRSIASVGDPKVSKGERREAGIQWIQPPKAVSDPEFRQTTSGAHGSANRADCLPRGKPFGAPAGAYPCPRQGLTRRLRHEGRAYNLHGVLIYFGGDPKGCRGERREAGIQWIQPPKAVSDPEFRQTTSGTHGSANRADCLPRGKPPARSAERFPCGGLTRRLRRGLGLAVPRGVHTFLSVAKEKCAKESQRHGDSRGGPPRFALRPSPALRLCLATRFMAFGHFWR